MCVFLGVVHDALDCVVEKILLLCYSNCVAALLYVWLRHNLSRHSHDMY
jgi:hypothetical protein